MTENENETRSNAIAAAIILLVAGAGLYFMPQVVLWLGQISPILGAAAGAAIVLAFFLIFWLRSRFKK
jgi:cyanate permease